MEQVAAGRRFRALRDGDRLAYRGDIACARPPFWGARGVAAGAVLVPAGALIFIALRQERSARVAGMGSDHRASAWVCSQPSIILIQEIVDWSERGSVTASFLFARSLGNTSARRLRLGAELGLLRLGHSGASSHQLRELLEQGSEAGRGVLGCAPRSNNRSTSPSRRCSRSRSWSRRPRFSCRKSSSLPRQQALAE